MPTTVTSTIGTTGTYTTIQAWEDAAPADLVVADQVWRGEVLAQTITLTATFPGVEISGSTTDSTRYKILTAQSGAAWNDNASRRTNPYRSGGNASAATITSAIGYQVMIDVSEAYCRITNLQITATSGSNACLSDGGGGNMLLENLIFEQVKTATAVVGLFGSSNTLRNCLVVNRGSGGAVPALSLLSGPTVENCTIVAVNGAVTTALRSSYGNAIVKNCAIFGYTALTAGAGTFTFTNCMTDTASPPTGVTNATYDTVLFTNITNGTHDLRPPFGSALINAGTTLASVPTDATLTARPQGAAYDVGAWESDMPAYLVGWAGSATTSVISGVIGA